MASKYARASGSINPLQPGHAVGPLRAHVQPAAPSPVLVGEQTIGIEVVGDPLAQLSHDSGVDFARVLDQSALGVCDVVGRDAGGQHVNRSAHGPNVVFADVTGLHRAGQLRQLRRQLADRSATAAVECAPPI